jgi:hypothetical protein
MKRHGDLLQFDIASGGSGVSGGVGADIFADDVHRRRRRCH